MHSKCTQRIYFNSTAGPTYELTIGNQEMSYSMKETAVYYAKEALKKHGMSQSAVTEIKNNMQYQYTGDWNCIVGPYNYYFSIWHKRDYYISFTLGKVRVMIYRSPD